MVTEIGSNLWNCLNVTEIDDFTSPSANCVPIRDVMPGAIKSCCCITECGVKLDTTGGGRTNHSQLNGSTPPAIFFT